MNETSNNIRIKWRKNDIIRNKSNGHPLLVLHVYKNMCTMVVDLEDTKALSVTYALLPKEYYHYAVDGDMKCEEESDNKTHWTFEPLVEIEGSSFIQQSI